MTAATVTSARRPRVATPERWAAALARANGIAYTVSVVPGQPVNCICEAGRNGDPVCQHKAAVLDRLGLLPRPVAPVAAAAPFVPRIIERAKSPAVKAALADLYGDDAA